MLHVRAGMPGRRHLQRHRPARGLAHFEDLNARLAKLPGWKPITQAKAPLPGHEQWKDVPDKLPLLKMPEL